MSKHPQPQLFIQTHLCLHNTVHLYCHIFPFYTETLKIAQFSVDKFHPETENGDDPAEGDQMLSHRGNIPPPPPLERHLTLEPTYFPVNNPAVNTTSLFPANFMP